jgi:carboxypeptidase family protein
LSAAHGVAAPLLGRYVSPRKILILLLALLVAVTLWIVLSGSTPQQGRSGARREALHLAVPHPVPHASALSGVVDPDAPRGSLIVRVSDEGGLPLEGAHVDVWLSTEGMWRTNPALVNAIASEIADASGEVRFVDLPQGDYYLMARADGHGPMFNSAIVRHEVGHKTMVLGPAFALRGKVLDAAGRPVAGARVIWDGRLGLNLGGARVTDATGAYETRGLSRGYRHLAVVLRSGTVVRVKPCVLIPAVSEHDVRLPVLSTLCGHVVDEQGNGVLGAAVDIVIERVLETVRTDATGRFAVEGVPAGSRVGSVRAEGFCDHPQYTTVHGPDGRCPDGPVGTEIVIRLIRGRTVRGRVTGGAENRPVAGAVLTLGSTSPIRSCPCILEAWIDGDHRAVTDSTGAFVFEHVAPWTYWLEVRADGWTRPPGERASGLEDSSDDPRIVVVRREGATPGLDVLLERTVSIRGVFLDAEGAPVADGKVEGCYRGHLSEVPDPRPARTGPDGRFEMLNLVPGASVTLTARRAGCYETEGVPARAPADCVVLRLAPEGRVVVTCRTESGSVPRGCMVSFNGGWTYRPVDASGRCRSPLIEAREYRSASILAFAPGFDESDEREVEVRAGIEIPVEIILSTSSPKDTGVAQGRVVDETGRPLVGVGVYADEGTNALLGRTDVDGRFHVPHLPSGISEVTLARNGFTRELASLADRSGSDVEVVLRRPGILAGTVRDVDGSPVRGVSVCAEPGTARAWPWRDDLRTRTDESGSFRLEARAEQVYRLEVRAGRVLTARGEVMPGGDPLELVVPTPLVIEGRIVDDAGRTVPRAHITAYAETPRDLGGWGQGDLRLAWAMSDESGRFRIGPLFDEVVTLHADPDLHGLAQVALTSVRAGSRGVLLRVERGVSLSGRIVTSGEQFGGGGYLVLAWREGRGRPYRCDSDGKTNWFWFRRLPPGRYVLAALANDGGVATPVPVEVRAPAKDATLTVERGRPVRILVRDSQGQPLSEERVHILRWNVGTRQGSPCCAQTDAAGIVTLGGFPAGEQPLWLGLEESRTPLVEIRVVAGGEPASVVLAE